MAKAYIETIDARIAELREEIEGLLAARRVIITITSEQPLKRKVGRPPKAGGSTQSSTMTHIVNILAQGTQAMRSIDIIEEMERQHGWRGDKRSVWNALWKLKQSGRIVHDPKNHSYMLKEKVQ